MLCAMLLASTLFRSLLSALAFRIPGLRLFCGALLSSRSLMPVLPVLLGICLPTFVGVFRFRFSGPWHDAFCVVTHSTLLIPFPLVDEYFFAFSYK
jgi:hypothetical protein